MTAVELRAVGIADPHSSPWLGPTSFDIDRGDDETCYVRLAELEGSTMEVLFARLGEVGQMVRPLTQSTDADGETDYSGLCYLRTGEIAEYIEVDGKTADHTIRIR